MAAESAWVPALVHPQLGPDEVHVWRTSLDAQVPILAQFEATLAPDERERAARFRFSQHRNLFTAQRGILREILSRYLRCAPDTITFRYARQGKPNLSTMFDYSGIRFNVSNSGSMAVYALALERTVGVDIEEVRPMPDAYTLTRRFFSRRELSTFVSLRDTDREIAFFRCWTCKEAYIKAIGAGLTMALDQIDLLFNPGGPVQIAAIQGVPEEAKRWTLRELEPAAGYVGALVVEGKIDRLRLFDLRVES